MQVVLVEPEIPPNTGNVARLCAATQLPLHLVGKLGFQITDRHLKRAGLDYWEWVQIHRHESVQEFFEGIPTDRLFFFSKRAEKTYVNAAFREDDFLVFGSETKEIIFKRVQKEARRLQTEPVSSEIIGLVPQDAINPRTIRTLHLENFHPSQILENRIAEVMNNASRLGGT